MNLRENVGCRCCRIIQKHWIASNDSKVVLTKKESRKYIRVFISNRRGEYCSRKFEQFCQHQGMRREKTTSYSPRYNGAVERNNRIVLNMVRSILTLIFILNELWPEAVMWSFHVLNWCPTYDVRNKIPEEAWSRKRPSIDYFCVFGCIDFIDVKSKLRSK